MYNSIQTAMKTASWDEIKDCLDANREEVLKLSDKDIDELRAIKDNQGGSDLLYRALHDAERSHTDLQFLEFCVRRLKLVPDDFDDFAEKMFKMNADVVATCAAVFCEAKPVKPQFHETLWDAFFHTVHASDASFNSLIGRLHEIGISLKDIVKNHYLRLAEVADLMNPEEWSLQDVNYLLTAPLRAHRVNKVATERYYKLNDDECDFYTRNPIKKVKFHFLMLADMSSKMTKAWDENAVRNLLSAPLKADGPCGEAVARFNLLRRKIT